MFFVRDKGEQQVRSTLGRLGWAQRFCVEILLWANNALNTVLEACTRSRWAVTEPKAILVLRTAALGDFLLSIPALKRLRTAYPASKITLLTTASTHQATLKSVESYAGQSSPWLTLLPPGLIDEVMTFSVRSYGGVLGPSRRLLRGKTYDVCFILSEGIAMTLSGTAKKLVLLRLMGIACRIYGIRLRAYPKLFPMAQEGNSRLEHHITALMRSVEENARVADTPEPPVYFDLARSPEAEKWADELLQELNGPGGQLIVIGPGSRLEFKRWPISHYAGLIELLLELSNTTIVLVGSGPELGTIELLMKECGRFLKDTSRLHSLGGRTSISELAALLRRASVFVGNDGGTCHLAAAVGCKVVSISNGAEVPNSVEPWENQRFTARFNVPCAPCYCFTYCPKNDNHCVTGIRVELVKSLVEKALREHEASRSLIRNGGRIAEIEQRAYKLAPEQRGGTALGSAKSNQHPSCGSAFIWCGGPDAVALT